MTICRPDTVRRDVEPDPKHAPTESIELSVEDVVRRARPHSPYGEMVIDDLDAEEVDAFIAAVLT